MNSFMKRCSRCGLEKARYVNFHRDKNTSDGYRYSCKACVKEQRELNTKGICPTCKQPKPSNES